MRERAYYHQLSSHEIATEILADPDATLREQVLAQRIRGGAGKWQSNQSDHRNEHVYD